MPIETFNFISGLNASNPVHSTDQVSAGDDHLRGIKLTLLNSWPNIDAAVNFTPAEGNYLVGVTSSIQVQLNGKAASSHNHAAGDISSGTLADARVAASNVIQHQASLTLTESQISDLQAYLKSGDSAAALTITALHIGNADTSLSRRAAGQIAVEGDTIFSHQSSAYASGKIHFSTVEPTTEGENGDIMLVY